MSRPSVWSLQGSLSLLALLLASACDPNLPNPTPDPQPPADTTPPTARATPVGGRFTSLVTVSLLCEDGEGSGCAGTYYTVDGAEPSLGSPLFREAIPIERDTTLKFFPVDKAGNRGAVKVEQYTVVTTPPDTTPPSTTASPTGGAINSSRSVALLCSDGQGSGCAATYYTLDGSTPTEGSYRYTTPLLISSTTTLRFFSVDVARNTEAVRLERYLFDATAPTVVASPAGGLSGSTQTVSLACDDGLGSGCAPIHYTTDGSVPTVSSPVYGSPLTVAASTTLRFVASDVAGNVSPGVTETYVIDKVAPTTAASPAGGLYASQQSVALACSDTGGAACAGTYYTLDGSTPSRSSPLYTVPLTLGSNVTLKFFSVDTVGNAGPVLTEQYTFDTVGPVTKPSPVGGSYSVAQSVTLSCTDAGSGCAETYYTVDGTTPTTSSLRYTGPLSLTASTTLKSFSVDAAGNAGTVRTDVYVIQPPSPDPSAQLAAVRSAADGSLSLPIEGALVTYVKPLHGTDPAGFFLQAEANGPALYVAVDPATLSPSPVVGDRVSLVVTEKTTVPTGLMVYATAISSFTRQAQDQPVEPLRNDVSNLNLPLLVNDYESELISISGTLTSGFGSAGVDHLAANLQTMGSSSTDQRLRLPSVLQEQLDLDAGCSVTAQTPLWRFGSVAQPSAWVSSDVTSHACPSPRLLNAIPSGTARVRVLFDRRLDPASVQSNGGQFTFDNGLVATAATVRDREVVVSTSSQVTGQGYTVWAATSLRDSRGASIDFTSRSAFFTGFKPSAQLRLSEVGPNIDQGRDLIELRVVQAGSVEGMTLVADTLVVATLPDVWVATGDILVVHLNPDKATGYDAPGSETAGKSGYPASTHPSNYDTAWDFHGGGAGLNALNNRVLRVRDFHGNTQDAVAFVNEDSSITFSTLFALYVRELQGEGHWFPSSCGGSPCTHTSSPSVLSLAASWKGCPLDRSGSVRRISSTDTQSAQDWAVGTSSFGLPNP